MSVTSARAPRALIAAALACGLAGCHEDDPAVDPVDAALDGPLDLGLDMAEPDVSPPDVSPPDQSPPDQSPPDMLPPDAEVPLGRFEALDRCLEDALANHAATAVAVAVVEGGALVHQAAFGHRNDPDQTPVSPSTLFRFGSTLKGMTALAVLGEVEAGRMAPDTPVAEVVPALGEHPDPRWRQVTVHHVLSHQGGFNDHILLEEPGAPDSRLGDYLASPAFANGAYFMVDPGTFYNYSNPNFMIAGRVLEVSTAATYREAMEDRVFAPLGMARVRFTAEEVLADGDFALGTTAGAIPGLLRAIPPDEYDNVWSRPAGFGWASVLDLARYAQYVIDGTALDGEAIDAPVAPETWAVWRAPYIDAEPFGVPTDYAYGLFVYHGVRLGIDDYRPLDVIAHGGNIPGYTSALVTVPALNLGASVLINGDGLNGPVEACLGGLVATAEGLPPAVEPPDMSPDSSTFGDYVGAYAGSPNVGPITITRAEDGGLDVSLPLVEEAGLPYERRLLPVGRDLFVLGIQGLQIPLTGIREGAAGPVAYLRTRYFVGVRAEMGGEEGEEMGGEMGEEMGGGMQKRRLGPDEMRRHWDRARQRVLHEPAPITAGPWAPGR